MSAIGFREVSKSFGPRRVLDRLSFAVAPGAALALVGPSGCGKTTALRILAGLEEPDHGSVTLEDRIVSGEGVRTPPWQRDIGFVFQDLALWPHLRVGRQLAFVLYRLARRERNARVQSLLELGELDEKARQFPAQLSGGEQQRVAILRALAPNPRILLLDEPFAHLDRRLRERFVEHIATLKSQGVAIIVATHHHEDVKDLAEDCVHVTFAP
jgi:iron(III) transport system ATP-binding protein